MDEKEVVTPEVEEVEVAPVEEEVEVAPIEEEVEAAPVEEVEVAPLEEEEVEAAPVDDGADLDAEFGMDEDEFGEEMKKAKEALAASEDYSTYAKGFPDWDLLPPDSL